MRVTVEVDDESGEVRVTTVGYNGQDPSIVEPLLTTSTLSALQRLRARRRQQLVETAAGQPLAAAVGVALTTSPPLPAPVPAADLDGLLGGTPPRPALALAPVLDDPAVVVDRVTVGDVVVPAPPSARAPRIPAAPPRVTAAAVTAMDNKRATALRMLDDNDDPFVIADQLGVSAGQIRKWARESNR